MKVIDIVKEKPMDSLAWHNWWKNRLTTEFVLKYGKRITITELVSCEACGGTAIVEDPMCNNCKQENYCE